MKYPHCPTFASLLTEHHAVTHRAHTRGWLETPDGRFFQPKAADVQFLKHCRLPLMPRRVRRHWLIRLMDIFA